MPADAPRSAQDSVARGMRGSERGGVEAGSRWGRSPVRRGRSPVRRGRSPAARGVRARSIALAPQLSRLIRGRSAAPRVPSPLRSPKHRPHHETQCVPVCLGVATVSRGAERETAGRRGGGTAGRRHGGTAGRRDGGTAGRRGGAARRLASNQRKRGTPEGLPRSVGRTRRPDAQNRYRYCASTRSISASAAASGSASAMRQVPSAMPMAR